MRELPRELSPAEAAAVLNFGKLTSRDFLATVLDLSRRGFIKLYEVDIEVEAKPETKADPGAKATPATEASPGAKVKKDYMIEFVGYPTELKPHEKAVMNMFFDTVGLSKEKFTFTELRQYARKFPQTFKLDWNFWRKGVDELLKTWGPFDERTKKLRSFQISCGFAGLILAVFSLVYLNLPLIALAALLGGLLLIFTGLLLRRRTQAGQDQYAQWMAFKKFLTDFSNLDKSELPAMIVWEHYLVYAVALGVARELIKQLQLVYPNLSEGNHVFGQGWLALPDVTKNADVAAGFDLMLTQLTSGLGRSVASAGGGGVSGGAGGGGGFSSVGGGGGGGGGGGFR